ncbi:MAG TPA: hypothetical protein VGC20_15250, partial [bacterium]
EELRAWLQGLLPAGAAGAPPVETVPDAAAALAAALESPARPVVATGSFWMLGDVMRLLADGPQEAPSAGPAPPAAAAGGKALR